MSRGTCASIWDLVWIPLFVYSEAAVQVQRNASLRGEVCFGWNVWEECCRNVLGEALLIRLRKASLGKSGCQ